MSGEDEENLLLEMEALAEENEQFRQRIEELEAELYGAAEGGEIAQFNARIEELENENEELKEALEAANASGGGSADELAQMDQQLQTVREELEGKQVEIVRLESTISQLESDKDDLAQKLHTEQEKARKKAKAAATSGKDTKQHKRELNRALNENVELRGEIQDLEMDRDKLIGAVEELHEEVQESRQKLATLQEEKDDAIKREEIKAEEIRAVRHELEETQNERQVLEQIQGLHEIALEEIQQRHDASTADIRRRLEHETREVARLTQENERLRDNTQVGALQIQLNRAKEDLNQSNEEVTQLKGQIDQAGEELTKVVQEYIMLEDDFNERVNEKVLDERKFIKALEDRLEQEKRATESAREDLSKLADDKAEVERLLNDADAKNARYERKEGLEEAVAHQKELKLEIRRRDRELSKVNHKLSEQLEANDLLTETLRRLKVEYNLPPDFEYPDLELREGIRSESERLKALNLMWEEQNSELESERTRLLQALRTQAQLSSEKGFKQFGLNAEQIQQLNFFAHQLKEGNAAEHIVLPEGPKMRKLVRENEQLKSQINRLEAKLDLMHERAPTQHSGATSQKDMDIEDLVGSSNVDRAGKSKRKNNRGRNRSESDDDSVEDDDGQIVERSKMNSELMSEVNDLRLENERLREQTRLKEDLPKIIQEQLRDFRSALTLATSSGAQNASIGQQQVDKAQAQAMLQLQRKLAQVEKRQEETQQLAALGKASAEKSRANLENSMRDLETSMHERVSSPRGMKSNDTAAKNAISEMVEKLKTAEMAKEEQIQTNKALQLRIEQLNQELQMTQQFMRQQQMQHRVSTQASQNNVINPGKKVPVDGIKRRQGRSGPIPTQDQMRDAEVLQSMPAHDEFRSWRQQQSSQQGMTSRFGTMGPAEMMMGASFGPEGVMLDATAESQMGPMSPSRHPHKYQGPKSPSARIMQARQVASLQLPPEDWADELAGINGQLIESLEELAAREDEITHLTDELGATRAVLRDVHAKETLLYREHIAQQKAYEGEMSRLQKAVDEATAERDQAAVKAARLDQLVSVLESEEGEGDPTARLRDTVRELTRRVAVFEVNQAIMSRKYKLLEKSDSELRKNHEDLQRDHAEMLRTLKLRVLYLELWRRGGQAAIEEQQRLLDDMVPKGEYHKAMRELDTVKERFRDLLVHEAELRSARSMEQDMPRKLQEAVLELRNRQVELKQANKQRNLAVQEAQRLQRLLDDRARMQNGTTNGVSRTDTSALISQNDKLVALVAKYKGKAEQLNVLLEGKDGNCRTYKHQLEQVQNRADTLMKENVALTDKLQSQRAVTQRAQDEARIVSDRWEGGATKEERKALEDSLAQREALYAGLAREAEQARVHADIASEQVSSMTAVRNSEKAELESLRETVLKLGSRSDDDTIIGKLTLELSQMKVSYQQFVRKYESTRATLRKSQLTIQKLEQQLDSKDAMLQETRMKSRVRILAAEKALLQLKDDAHPSKNGGAGSIVSQLESLNQKIRDLSKKGEESAAALLDAEKGRIKLEGVLQEKEEEYQRTQEQLKDFKMFVNGRNPAPRANIEDSMLEGGDGTEPEFLKGEQNNDMSGGQFGGFESHSRDVARRLLSLSEELKAAKLRVLRQDRELKLLKDEARNLQRQVKRDDEIQRKLEEDLVQAQTALREKELQALREAEMDMQGTMGNRFRRDELGDRVGEDDEFNGSTLGLSLMIDTMPGQKTNAPNRTFRRTVLPAWAEDEANKSDVVPGSPSTPQVGADEGTIRRMESDNITIAKQMRKIAELESQIRGLHAELEKERYNADRKGQKADLYSKQLRSEGLPVLDASVDQGRVSSSAFGEKPLRSSSPGTPGTIQARGEFYAGEANRLQHAARQTIAQLRSMLDKKSRLVEDYKRKLTEVRKRSTLERQQDQEEIRRLTDRLYEENKVAIDKLRSAFDNLENSKMAESGRAGGNVNLTLMECMDQMTEAAAKKDRRLSEMQGELSAKQHQLRLAEQRAGAALTELDEMRRQASHLKRVVDSQVSNRDTLCWLLSPRRGTPSKIYDARPVVANPSIVSSNVDSLVYFPLHISH